MSDAALRSGVVEKAVVEMNRLGYRLRLLHQAVSSRPTKKRRQSTQQQQQKQQLQAQAGELERLRRQVALMRGERQQQGAAQALLEADPCPFTILKTPRLAIPGAVWTLTTARGTRRRARTSSAAREDGGVKRFRATHFPATAGPRSA